MVTTLELVVLVVAAFGAGTVDAIAGGGGLVTVPALFAVGLPPHVVYGTNKGQSVFGAAAALVTFWRARVVTRRIAPYTFALGFAGSLVGAITLTRLSAEVLRPLAIVMLLAAAAVMLVRKPARTDDAPTARAFGWALALALVIGCYDGFFGPGTGTFLIIGFVLLCGASLPRATADAKVVNFASNLAAVIWLGSHGAVLWQVALPMAAAQLVGGMVGSRLALRGGAGLIRVIVVCVSLGLVGRLAWDLYAG
jgi:uncharacterized membrane protein YfcA